MLNHIEVILLYFLISNTHTNTHTRLTYHGCHKQPPINFHPACPIRDLPISLKYNLTHSRRLSLSMTQNNINNNNNDNARGSYITLCSMYTVSENCKQLNIVRTTTTTTTRYKILFYFTHTHTLYHTLSSLDTVLLS